MQISCPNCGARYTVDPVALGPAGRTVQCFRCNHRWFEELEPETAPVDENVPEERPVPDFVIRPQTYGAALPAIADSRDFPSWAKVLIGVAVLAGLLVGLGWLFKEDIGPMLPPELRNQLGMTVAAPGTPPPALTPAKAPTTTPPTATAPAAPPVAPPSTPAESPRPQLEVDLAASKVDFIDGRYVVRGEIVNKGKAPGTTRTLKLIFKKDSDVLGERAYALIEGPIAPGTRRPFSQVLDDPPAGTTDIVPAIE
jgi:predicted Zn finger-like uncharacterized protein